MKKLKPLVKWAIQEKDGKLSNLKGEGHLYLFDTRKDADNCRFDGFERTVKVEIREVVRR